MNVSVSDILGDPARLAAVRRSGLLDSLPEESFDRLTRLAARLLNTPVALVTLLDEDRQFFKSAVGLGEPWASRREMPVAYSYCRYAADPDQPLLIEDARLDPRTQNSPAIAENQSLAYAGVPLTSDGQVLGTLCVVDTKIRRWTETEIQALRDLAAAAQTEVQLRRDAARQEEQAALLEATHDSILVRDLEDRITFWNRGAAVRYGWTREEAVGQVTHELLQTHFPAPLGEIEATLLREGRWEGDLIHTARDGQELVVDSRWVLQRDARGEPVAVLETNHDVTVQRKAQQQLRATASQAQLNLARLEAVLAALPVGVFITNEAGEVTIANPAASQIWGGETPLVGIESYGEYRAWHADSGKPVGPEEWPIARAVRSGKSVLEEEFEIEAFDGTRKTVMASGVLFRDTGGQVIGGIALNVDVSDRKRAEEALVRSEARFRSMIENASEMVTILDAVGTMRYETPAMTRVLGYSPGDLMDRNFLDFTHPEDVEPMIERFQQVLQNPAGQVPWQLRFRHKDGSYRWLEGVSTNLLDDPAVGGIVANSRDITERVEVEQKLAAYSRELERSNQELQDFAYIASHDLQEPLRKVQAFGDRLQSRYAAELGEVGADYLARMQGAANRMQLLIQDLLAYSRVTSKAQPFVPVDLDRVAREILWDLEIRFRQTGGRLEIDELPVVDADPMQMRQLFQNLIANALKFHREGVPPRVRISAERVEEMIEIRVEDNGIGFEEQYLDRIFAPFERLHGRSEYEGTGMGLAICRKIAQRHGGDITARSTPGAGTIFVVTLPVQHTTERGEA